MRRAIRLVAPWLITVSCFQATSYGQDVEPRDELGAAVADLEGWLGRSPGGDGWTSFLRLGELRSQLTADRPDPTVVGKVLKRFRSTTAGLDRPRFVRVRRALEAWESRVAVPRLAELPALAREQKGAFTPVSADDVQQARTELTRSVADLNRFLGAGENGQSWRSYLKLDALAGQLEPGAEPTPEAVNAVLSQLQTDQPGLEQPRFAGVASALRKFVSKRSVARNPKAPAEYQARLDEFAARLETYLAQPSQEKLLPLAADVDWLEERGQAPGLVRHVRHHLSQPNLLVDAQHSFISSGMNRHVDEVAPIRDTIMGTRVVGSGRTNAEVSFRFVPDSDKAMIEAELKGVNHSRTTGYNGPAIIYSAGATQLVARKRLIIDADGIHGLAATASADTSSQITGIGSSKRGIVGCVVKSVAARKAPQQKGAAESIAEQRAERRLNAQFEDQVGQQLARANHDFLEKFRNPLVRRGQYPRLHFSTTGDVLRVAAIQSGRGRFAAPGPAPALAKTSQINIRLHESMVENLAAGLGAGQTIGQKELEEAAMKTLGRVPERLKPLPDKEPGSITLADEQPVSFRIRDGIVAFTVRGKKYTSGDRSYPGMNFTVRYKLEPAGKGLRGTRQGEVQIYAPGYEPETGRTTPLRLTVIKSLLTRRLNKVFEPEIVSTEPTELPGEWKKAGPLAVSHVSAEQEWLSLGFNQDLPSTSVAQAPSPQSGR